MRKIPLVLFCLLLSGVSFSCECIRIPLINEVISSDFVATGKVISFMPDKENEDLYNLEIALVNVYKGQRITRLKVNGRKTMCELIMPPGSTWLIFAAKDKNGNITVSDCSGSKQLDRNINPEGKYPEAQKRYNSENQTKLDVLSYLKEKNIEPKNTYGITAYIGKSLDSLKGFDITGKRFALYKVIVNTNLGVADVLPIKEFGNEKLSADLLAALIQKIKIFKNDRQPSIPKPTEIILGVYYYDAEDVHPSFISLIDL